MLWLLAETLSSIAHVAHRHHRLLQIITLWSFPSRLMSESAIDKRKRLKKIKSFVLSSLSEQETRAQYKGRHSSAAATSSRSFKQKGKNRYCMNVALSPPHVISVSVWRVLFEFMPDQLGLPPLYQDHHCGYGPHHSPLRTKRPHTRVQSMHLLLWKHSKLSVEIIEM